MMLWALPGLSCRGETKVTGGWYSGFAAESKDKHPRRVTKAVEGHMAKQLRTADWIREQRNRDLIRLSRRSSLFIILPIFDKVRSAMTSKRQALPISAHVHNNTPTKNLDDFRRTELLTSLIIRPIKVWEHTSWPAEFGWLHFVDHGPGDAAFCVLCSVNRSKIPLVEKTLEV